MRLLKAASLPLLLIGLFMLFPPGADAMVSSIHKKSGGKSAFVGGGFSMGLGIAQSNADQSGLNEMIHDAKANSSATTSDFGTGLEYMAHFTFRFSNNFVAIQLRPTYFTQSTDGSGSGGNYDYKLTGYTVFPLVRLIPLSNDIIDFYLQAGLGYGKLDGSITNGTRTASFSGSSFGSQVGVGADFCLFSDNCFGVEGNYRYLPISRNIVSSSSGGLINGASQSQTDRELENLNGSDVATSLTGISIALTYTFIF